MPKVIELDAFTPTDCLVVGITLVCVLLMVIHDWRTVRRVQQGRRQNRDESRCVVVTRREDPDP